MWFSDRVLNKTICVLYTRTGGAIIAYVVFHGLTAKLEEKKSLVCLTDWCLPSGRVLSKDLDSVNTIVPKGRSI